MVRLFGKRVLRLILGPRQIEMYGGWRILHYAEVHRLYPSQNCYIRVEEMGRVCCTHGRYEKYTRLAFYIV